MQNETDLKTYLQSLHAIIQVPFPAADSPTQERMTTIRIKELIDPSESLFSFWDSSAPPSTSFHFPPSVFFQLSEPMWQSLRSHLDPALMSFIFNKTSLYHCVVGNRYLELSTRLSSNHPSFSTNSIKQRRISKVECLYRNNWNKKYPLGKSNPIYFETNPVDFSKAFFVSGETLSSSLIDLVWTIKHKASSLSVENLLGYCCPIPTDLESVRTMTNLDVFRTLSLVPRFTVSNDRVAWAVSKLLGSILPDKIWCDGVAWRRSIVTYLSLGRYDSMDVCIAGVNPKISMFVFKKIIIPLISYMFYCTDSDAFDDPQLIVYFRRPVWDLVVTKASRGLVELLQLTEVPTKTSVGASVRWLPKKKGLRPVVRQPKLLKDKAKKLLRYLSAIKATENGNKLLGVSAFTREDCVDGFRRISRYRKQHDPNDFDQLYFFSADIQNCFESISFDSLESALENFCNPNILFSSCMVATQQMDNISTPIRKRPIVFLRNDLLNLIDQLPLGRKRPVVVRADLSGLSDERWSYGSVRAEIMRMVRDVVYDLPTNGSTTTVSSFKVGCRGLAQGSSFSVILVSILFGWLDKSVLSDIDPNQTALCRLVDDIICLSWNGQQIDTLYDFIVKKQAYGTINQEKLCAGVNPNNIHWAGLSLSPDLNGDINISTRKDTYSQKSLSSRKRSGSTSIIKYFESSLGRSIAQSCLRMLFDDSINSQQCINENAYRAGQMAGKRLSRWIIEKSDPRESVVNMEIFIDKIRRFSNRRFSQKLARIFSCGFLHSFS